MFKCRSSNFEAVFVYWAHKNLLMNNKGVEASTKTSMMEFFGKNS